MKISENIAKLISVLFHPLLMPTIGILMIFWSGTYLSFIPFEGKRLIFVVIFAGTFVIPISIIPFFLFFKIISNIEIDNPSQRLAPLIIISFLYFCTFYIMQKIPIPFINLFVLASASCVLLNTVITSWWKISSHLLGAGGLTGLIIAMFFRLNANISLLLIISIIIAGLTGFARLRLNAHTPEQIYSGFLIGFFLVGGVLLI